MARLLIEKGADVNTRRKKWTPGWTPLHDAAEKNLLDVARLLIDRGADIDAKSNDGFTPLDTAVPESLDVARLLIEHGANTDGIDLSWMDEQGDA